jgi:hypothetical protein
VGSGEVSDAVKGHVNTKVRALVAEIASLLSDAASIDPAVKDDDYLPSDVGLSQVTDLSACINLPSEIAVPLVGGIGCGAR